MADRGIGLSDFFATLSFSPTSKELRLATVDTLAPDLALP